MSHINDIKSKLADTSKIRLSTVMTPEGMEYYRALKGQPKLKKITKDEWFETFNEHNNILNRSNDLSIIQTITRNKQVNM